MDRRKFYFVIPLILIAAIFAGINFPITAHAAPPSTVCLNDASASAAPPANPCPASPYVFNGPFPSTPQVANTQIRVGVYLNSTGGMDGFDITLLTNHLILVPASSSLSEIILTGSLLNTITGPPVVVVLCVGGQLITGSTCSATDTIDTIHFAATTALGASLVTSSGLLFTVVYNVTGATPSSGQPLGFQTGCGASSVPNVCVTIANGTPTPNAAQIQAGTTFNNSACLTTCGWFALAANATSTTSLLGSTLGSHVAITGTSKNGGPVLGSIGLTLTAVVTSGFGAPTFSSTTCNPTATVPCSVVVSFSTSTPGTYAVTVFGSYVGDNCGGLGACTTTYSLIAPVNFVVNIQSVSWTVNGVFATSTQTNYYAKGSQSLVDVFTSLGGYSGSLTLAQATCSAGTTGVLCPLSLPPTFAVGAGQKITKLINFTSTASGRLLYRDSLTATGLPLTSQGTDTILISGFNMVSNSTSVTFVSGDSAHVGVTLTSQGAVGFQFAGSVAIGSTSTPSGVTAACSPLSVTLAAGGTATTTCALTGMVASTQTFSATITGTGGTNNAMINSTAAISVTVKGAGPPPGINISANPTSVITNVGLTGGTSIVTVASRGGFTGTVSLGVTATGHATCSLSSTSVVLGTSGTSTLSCNSTTAETDTATVTATSGSTTNSTSVTFQFRDFSTTASLTSVTTTVGISATSIITVSPLNAFSGTVSLGVTTNSTSLSCTLSSSSISGGSGTSTLSCAGSPAGNYLATVTGTSGSLSHSATVTYHVNAAPDFSVTANPTAVTVTAGGSGTSTISVSAANGFTSTVTLAVTTNSTNLACALSSASVTGGSGTSTLSCSASIVGNYLATITGTSGSLSHPATVTYHVTAAPDFSLTANPTTVNANAGATGTSTIAVAPLNGFTGTVTLAVTTNSTNLICALSSMSITGGSGSSTLSCHASPAANYLATVTGTSGALSHSATVTFQVRDFTIVASQASVSVSVNTPGTSTITIAPVNGFASAVTLAVTTNSTNLSCTLSSTSIAGGSGTSTLSCTGSVAGNYLATVTGSSGSLSHSATVTFHVTAAADFSITANPATVSVNAGATATSTITIASLNGFTNPVTLAVTTNSTNLVCTLSSSSITGGSGSSTLSCHGSPAGNLQATVTGSSGSLSHSAIVTYHVQDFSLTASPTTVSTSVNVAGTSTITVASLNGFAGTVTLSVTTNSTNLACTLSSTSITGGSGTSMLSCTSGVAANYLVTVTGTSSSLSHSAAVTYHVTAAADFSLTASPTTVTVLVGTAGTSTITVASLNGFSGTVTLAVTTNSTNLSCTLSSASVTGGSGTSTLSCTGSPVGNYLATVAGTSGTLSHFVPVTYNVTPAPDFSISAKPTSVTVALGVAGTSTISVAPLNGFTSTVTLSVGTNSTNLNCTLSATSISGGSGSSTLSCTASVSGNYLATVAGTSGSLSHSATVTYHVVAAADFTIAGNPTTVTVAVGTAGTSTITIAPVNGFSGTVSLTVTTNSTNLSCSLSSTSITSGSGISTLSCASSAAGNFLATVTAISGTLTHSSTVTYHITAIPDFAIGVSPTSITVTQGKAGNATITVSPMNGFTGTVTLSATTSLASLSCSLSTTSITGGSGTSTLSCTSSTTGSFTAIVTGTSGSISHSATVTFNVAGPADFTISADPTSVSFTVGSSASTTITVTSVNGFTGNVSLTTSVSPSGLTATCSPTTISLGISGTSSCTLSSSIAGSYTVTVTGTSGTLSHSANISATVTQVSAGDFTITASRTLITLGSNTHTAYAVILRSNGFVGIVTLTLTVTPTVVNGVTATLKFSSLMLTLSGSNASNVMVFDTSSTPPGNYTITINGTSGSLSHSATTIVTVSAARSVLLTFNGFSLDDFDNGVGQFQVQVNGQLVVDIPAGLNNLSGTGDFTPYVGTTVNFGPFDITNLLVQGQNIILFTDPTPFDHFGVVSGVRITQGDTLLLSMARSRGIYPGHSAVYTFSNPPLEITSLTGSTQTPTVDQGVTLTATYTGGTAPFRCVFRFGDGGSAEVLGSAGSCSAIHHYDSSGTFNVSVTVKGASSSDLVTGRVPVIVTSNQSFPVAMLSV